MITYTELKLLYNVVIHGHKFVSYYAHTRMLPTERLLELTSQFKSDFKNVPALGQVKPDFFIDPIYKTTINRNISDSCTEAEVLESTVLARDAEQLAVDAALTITVAYKPYSIGMSNSIVTTSCNRFSSWVKGTTFQGNYIGYDLSRCSISNSHHQNVVHTFNVQRYLNNNAGSLIHIKALDMCHKMGIPPTASNLAFNAKIQLGIKLDTQVDSIDIDNVNLSSVVISDSYFKSTKDLTGITPSQAQDIYNDSYGKFLHCLGNVASSGELCSRTNFISTEAANEVFFNLGEMTGAFSLMRRVSSAYPSVKTVDLGLGAEEKYIAMALISGGRNSGQDDNCNNVDDS